MTTSILNPAHVEDVLDPVRDSAILAEREEKSRQPCVGSERPSAMMYTYGPGSIVDLPHFTVMPAGYDDWEPTINRMSGAEIVAPRLLDAVRVLLGRQVERLVPYPWKPERHARSPEHRFTGVPARVFPQWLRCTRCDMLAPLSRFGYVNTNPFRPDAAEFVHRKCRGRRGRRKPSDARAVAARYLLVCENGHVDEFPYELWVHDGATCPVAAVPSLYMRDRTVGKGATATIECRSCGEPDNPKRRGMNEAQGQAAIGKLPRCRGRQPHLGGFEQEQCDSPVRLMLVGASNLWFSATQSIIVMPRSEREQHDDLVDRIRTTLGDKLPRYAQSPEFARDYLGDHGIPEVSTLSDEELQVALEQALHPVEEDAEDLEERRANWDPIELLVPEWTYLQREPSFDREPEPTSGLLLTRKERDPQLPSEIARVLAVEKLRKVNALVGFTRVDDMDRVNDLPKRLVPLSRTGRPTWTVATEDRGEGIYLQLDEDRVDEWERRVLDDGLWEAHRSAHERNFANRYSETAADVNPDDRLPPPRYWLLHTLSHVLIRAMAMDCGYASASISERIYAWRGQDGREPAAGVLICTTASDSDGTLGGLVQLAEPARMEAIVRAALVRAVRCSSDPICALRTPRDPEDFLHGAACHCCVMASETSCERANRFLDRRFLLDIGGNDLGFFGAQR